MECSVTNSNDYVQQLKLAIDRKAQQILRIKSQQFVQRFKYQYAVLATQVHFGIGKEYEQMRQHFPSQSAIDSIQVSLSQEKTMQINLQSDAWSGSTLVGKMIQQCFDNAKKVCFN